MWLRPWDGVPSAPDMVLSEQSRAGATACGHSGMRVCPLSDTRSGPLRDSSLELGLQLWEVPWPCPHIALEVGQ